MSARLRTILLIAVLTVVAGCGARSVPTNAAPSAAEPTLMAGLGSYSRPVPGVSDEVQRWFDQGLRLVYAFNHQAAADAFAQAAKLDPDCAMCLWGQALALGPNINSPMLPEAIEPAHAVSQRALALAGSAAPADQALIRALALRYVAQPPADRKELDRAYAAAMAQVVRDHPADLNAAVLYAEALMDLSPWSYWGRDGEPLEHTDAIVATLESVLARDRSHIGAIHYYIHAVEASPEPQRAETYADTLEQLAPSAGHLVHMPAHIYIRVGRYHDATLNNLRATEADQRFMAVCRGSNGVYPLGYVPHNWHFMAMSAGLEGNARMSLHAAEQTAQRVDAALLDQLTFLQAFLVTPLQSQVRFGRWDAILAQPEPPAQQPYPRAIWHYARGLALLAGNQPEAAELELQRLTALADDPALAAVWLSSSNIATPVVAIARDVLRGELAAHRGDVDGAVAALEAAVAGEDALGYMEPPDWALPVRQTLGAVLLQAGRAPAAEAAFRADLATWPENGWSLRGLEQALAAQQRDDEAAAVRARFDVAWQWADTPLDAPRL
jgi:tetratricopeptide (TPR) repeat protein